MGYVGPELLTSDHVVAGFDCGKEALSTWLVRRALANRSSGASRTWVVSDEVCFVAGYYASATAAILRAAATPRAARNQPEEIPAILLARLAVDLKHQHRGLGSALLKHFLLKAKEVAEVVGVRLVLVHAKEAETRDFYLRYDFQPSPVDDLVLMIPLQDLG